MIRIFYHMWLRSIDYHIFDWSLQRPETCLTSIPINCYHPGVINWLNPAWKHFGNALSAEVVAKWLQFQGRIMENHSNMLYMFLWGCAYWLQHVTTIDHRFIRIWSLNPILWQLASSDMFYCQCHIELPTLYSSEPLFEQFPRSGPTQNAHIRY